MAMASRAYDHGDNERAHELARQLGTDFVALNGFRIPDALPNKAPRGLIFRCNFVPLEETLDGKVTIAVADPSPPAVLDQIKLALKRGIVTQVSTLRRIGETLTRTEQSQPDGYR